MRSGWSDLTSTLSLVFSAVALAAVLSHGTSNLPASQDLKSGVFDSITVNELRCPGKDAKSGSLVISNRAGRPRFSLSKGDPESYILIGSDDGKPVQIQSVSEERKINMGGPGIFLTPCDRDWNRLDGGLTLSLNERGAGEITVYNPNNDPAVAIVVDKANEGQVVRLNAHGQSLP